MRVFSRLLAVALVAALLVPWAPLFAQVTTSPARTTASGSHTFAIAFGIADPLLISLSYAGAPKGPVGWYFDVGSSGRRTTRTTPITTRISLR